MTEPIHPDPKRRRRKTSTLWLSGDWEGLSALQLKLKLLELTVSSEEGLKRFWVKVPKSGPDDCWEWVSTRSGKNYGLLHFMPERGKRHYLYAHRVSYFIAHKYLPEEMDVLHTCDNPPCCNPNHLFLGTQKDNVADMVAKGRQLRGAKVYTNKLTPEEVQQIRILHFRDNLNYVELGRRFHVSDEQARCICLFVYWKYLPIPKEVLDAF